MALIPSIPVTLLNGTIADATQVMANFDAIQTSVNANAAANGINNDITQLTGLTTALSVSQGGTGVTSFTSHGVITGGPAGLNSTGAGVAGSVLTSNGSTADPTFQPSVPTGSIILWSTNTAPTSFLECNGTAVSRTIYANLFAVIGVTFGEGDGVTTFNLPDMRGQFARGWDDGAGVDPGRAFGSTQASAIQSFTAPVTGSITINKYSGVNAAASTDYFGDSNGTGPVPVTFNFNTGAAATYTGAAETRPTNLALMYCIRT